MRDILIKLFSTINKKIKKKNLNSYSYFLYKKGKFYCKKKLSEEYYELISAFNKKFKRNIIHETADFIYHLLVMLRIERIHINEIFLELQKRTIQSGFEEKKNRKNVRSK